jgi:hypothetical protein
MKTDKMRNPLLALIVTAGLGFAISTASAHTISMGSFNAGAPGSVSIAMGSYDHGSTFNEGAITLIAGPGIPPTVGQNFSSLLLSQPGQLVDGVNNFYADSTGATWGTLPSDSYNQSTNTVGLGPVVAWQVATFTGLTAGLYTYQLTGMVSQNWNNVNSFQDNWTGTILIPDGSINGVPDGGSTALLMGLTLLGFGAVRRKLR